MLSITLLATGNLIVNTSLGPIQGNQGNTTSCASFYGVPYAAAPVGQSRFKPPQSAQAWMAPRPAFKVGRSCLQTFADGEVKLPLALEELLEELHIGMEPMAEDCLFLNVFAPGMSTARTGSSTAALKPVMVWFHGGSYLGGSGDLQSTLPLYDGRAFCHASDVVIVSVNYRLGIFGFYASDALVAEGGTAGNMGIQDQRFALEWVQANAHHFGGDKDKVTIFGESAGGGSVATHLTAHRSRALFSRGIMQSGGLWLGEFMARKQHSAAVAAAAGCRPTTNATGEDDGVLACLRELKGLELLHKQLDGGGTSSWGPTADGFEYAKGVTQRQLLSSGSFAPKPMLVGTNLNESALFDCPPFGAPLSANLSEREFRRRVGESLRLEQGSAALDKVVSAYSAGDHYAGSWRAALIDVHTDVEFFCGSRTLLDATANQSQPAFAYLLRRPVRLLSIDPCWGPEGVPHMTDVLLLWGNVDQVLTQEERALGARMRTYWASFAKEAAPAPEAAWPVWHGSAQSRRYLALDAPGADVPGEQWKKRQCDLLDAIRYAQQAQ